MPAPEGMFSGSHSLSRKLFRERVFLILAYLCLLFALTTLFLLFSSILEDGLSRLSLKFLTSYPSRRPEAAGIASALAGSFAVGILTGILTLPLGIFASIYLEELSRKNLFTQIVEVNIANLAGVPSILYGLLGLEVFVRLFDLKRSLLAGALTLTLLVLPMMIVASREAFRAIPGTIREAALALGASRWQVVRDHLLPLAFPGIMTGVILSLSRALGETAPLITIGALTYVAFLPDSLFSPFTVLPIQIFNWVSRPQREFHDNAAAAIVVLLLLTLSLNALAIWIRQRFQKKGFSSLM